MANTDKNIVITPNTGQSTDPQIVFSGASSTLGPQNITLRVYPTDGGTLSFEGSSGQLFSLTNSLTGTIYSVNDVSGIPSIEVLDTGLVKLAQYGGNIVIGSGADNGVDKVQITGSVSASSFKGSGSLLTGIKNSVSYPAAEAITLGDPVSYDTTNGLRKTQHRQDLSIYRSLKPDNQTTFTQVDHHITSIVTTTGKVVYGWASSYGWPYICIGDIDDEGNISNLGTPIVVDNLGEGYQFNLYWDTQQQAVVVLFTDETDNSDLYARAITLLPSNNSAVSNISTRSLVYSETGNYIAGLDVAVSTTTGVALVRWGPPGFIVISVKYQGGNTFTYSTPLLDGSGGTESSYAGYYTLKHYTGNYFVSGYGADSGSFVLNMYTATAGTVSRIITESAYSGPSGYTDAFDFDIDGNNLIYFGASEGYAEEPRLKIVKIPITAAPAFDIANATSATFSEPGGDKEFYEATPISVNSINGYTTVYLGINDVENPFTSSETNPLPRVGGYIIQINNSDLSSKIVDTVSSISSITGYPARYVDLWEYNFGFFSKHKTEKYILCAGITAFDSYPKIDVPGYLINTSALNFNEPSSGGFVSINTFGRPEHIYTNANNYIGVANNSATVGQSVEVVSSGKVTLSNLTPGQKYYVKRFGGLKRSYNPGTFAVGVAFNSAELVVSNVSIYDNKFYDETTNYVDSKRIIGLIGENNLGMSLVERNLQTGDLVLTRDGLWVPYSPQIPNDIITQTLFLTNSLGVGTNFSGINGRIDATSQQLSNSLGVGTTPSGTIGKIDATSQQLSNSLGVGTTPSGTIGKIDATSQQLSNSLGVGTAPSGTVGKIDATSQQLSNSLGVGTAPSGVIGEIRATNNITAYFSSDKTQKENIVDIDNALNKVLYIGGKYFEWTDDYIKEHGGEDNYFIRKSDFGVIAQDVQEVFPVAVRQKSDGKLAVDYEKLCALAFAAIKELNKKIEKLTGAE